MEGDGIAVAKVDATIEVSLASRMGISGYPSLLLYANADGGTKMYKYQGARSTERLAEFARGGYTGAIHLVPEPRALLAHQRSDQSRHVDGEGHE